MNDIGLNGRNLSDMYGTGACGFRDGHGYGHGYHCVLNSAGDGGGSGRSFGRYRDEGVIA